MTTALALHETSAAQPLTSVEAEAVLLSALIGNNLLVDQVADTLTADDFADCAHARIYETMLALTAAGKPAGTIQLASHLRGDPMLEHVGDVAYFASLSGGSARYFAKPRELADQIIDLSARRRLLVALDEARATAANMDVSLSELVDLSDAALVAAVEKRESWAQPDLGEAIGEAIERINLIQRSDGRIGATTGIHEVDQLLGGCEAGQLIVIAGRPGMGKTALASSVTLGFGRRGHGVFFASLEMKAVELGMRMVCDLCYRPGSVSSLPFDRVVNGELNATEMRELCRAQESIKEWPVRFLDAGSVTISRLSLAARRAKRRMAAKGQKLEVLIIDYMQLVQPDHAKRSVYEAVSEVSRGLKALAKELGICIIALAQLSRAVEAREDKRPQLSDLRDSGQIEQDADAVLFMHREEYYLRLRKPKAGGEELHEQALRNAAGRMDLILAKRRNGRTGERTVHFHADHQAIRSRDGAWH